MKNGFFVATQESLGAITGLFDFVWPAAVGLWNLRWQVSGYAHARGQRPSVPELRARFVEGSGIHGANLHRACIDKTWEEQQADLAKVVLLNLVSIYEGWATDLVAELSIGPASVAKNTVQGLQFPTASIKGKPSGVSVAVACLATPACHAMEQDVYPLRNGKAAVSMQELEDLEVVYRFFKETRNCLMHQSGRASQRQVDAFSSFTALAAKPKLSFSIPQHHAAALSDPVRLSLHGVVGFGDILRRMMLTIDAEALRGTPALQVLLARWQTVHGVVSLKRDAKSKAAQLRLLLAKVDVPSAKTTTSIESELRSAGLIK